MGETWTDALIARWLGECAGRSASPTRNHTQPMAEGISPSRGPPRSTLRSPTNRNPLGWGIGLKHLLVELERCLGGVKEEGLLGALELLFSLPSSLLHQRPEAFTTALKVLTHSQPQHDWCWD